MRVQTEEWRRFIPGVRMYKGKKTLFYNGEKLWDERTGAPLIYDKKERQTWEVIIVLRGVKSIPKWNFLGCENVSTVVMNDTVKRIEDMAFNGCTILKFVKLSRNLAYIGEYAFADCVWLRSIFIPPSCRGISTKAFWNCMELLILQVPQYTPLNKWIIARSLLIERSPFEVNFHENHFRASVRDVYHKHDSSFLGTLWQKKASLLEVNVWIKTINLHEQYTLHHECSSYEPSKEKIIEILKDKTLRSMLLENEIGVTPSTYLKENPFHEINEQKIINAYIFDLMGETLKHSRRESFEVDDNDITIEGANTDLLHVESVETNASRVILSLDEQMSRQARWKSNYMFLRIKNRESDRIVKVIKVSLDEEQTLEEVLKDSTDDPYLLRIDDEVFEWAAIKTIQVFDLPTLCGERKKFTLTW